MDIPVGIQDFEKKKAIAKNLDTRRVNEAIDVPLRVEIQGTTVKVCEGRIYPQSFLSKYPTRLLT